MDTNSVCVSVKEVHVTCPQCGESWIQSVMYVPYEMQCNYCDGRVRISQENYRRGYLGVKPKGFDISTLQKIHSEIQKSINGWLSEMEDEVGNFLIALQYAIDKKEGEVTLPQGFHGKLVVDGEKISLLAGSSKPLPSFLESIREKYSSENFEWVAA